MPGEGSGLPAPGRENAGRILLVSDLHLSEERPETTERFFRFLAEEARDARALYVLGDLFESWIGDDDLDAREGGALGRAVVDALAGLSQRGILVFLMHGNRDFLIGERLCRAAAATLLDDPTVVDLASVRTLLMHGDTLCTDDLDYQSWRATARSEAWQAQFLARPVSERREIAGELRQKSRAMTRSKPPEIMDVNEAAVHAALRREGVRRLIHGHTHRPAMHELQVDGRACQRWVLPDWYGTGGYMEVAGDTPRLVQFENGAGD